MVTLITASYVCVCVCVCAMLLCSFYNLHALTFYLFCWNCADDPDKFTIHLDHNGFFCGLKDSLAYVSGSVDYWDNCNTDTFSLLWIEEFIKQGGNEMTARTSVYWLLPGKSMSDGLCLIENDSHILAMMAAVHEEKTLCLMVDHTNFLKDLREDVPVQIPSKYTCPNISAEIVNGDFPEISGSAACIGGIEKESEDEDGDTDSEFYDSDYDVEDGALL